MKLLNEMFASFKKTAYRIETFSIYSDYDFKYQAYNQGKIMDDYSDINWCNSIRQWTKENKIVERIRVIPKEFNPYLIFEFECYEKNILVGEKILAIYEKEYKKICNEKEDFWIFDSNKIIKMNYDSQGIFLNSKLVNDKSHIAIYEKLRAKTLQIEEIYKIIRNQKFYIN